MSVFPGVARFKMAAGLCAVALLSAGCAVQVAGTGPKPAAVAEKSAPEAIRNPAYTENFVGIDAYKQVADMARGVNVLSEDPGWTDPAQGRFKPEYFAKIKQAGFSTVRIVINSYDHMDPYYVLETGFLKRLDTMVDAGLAAGLNVILDEHDFNYCGEHPGPCTQKLNAFWAQIAPRYKNYSNRLIFEVLNEPHQKFTPELWNAQIKQTLPIIRATNPVRNVIIGPANWYGIAFLPKLELPVADRHLIISFHYYTPMEFTHQGSPWVMQYKLTHRSWGSEKDLAELNSEFDKVQAWSEKWNRPIFLGEFGAYETAPEKSRELYDFTVARAAEKRGWAWAYWQFDKDFTLYDISKDQWVKPILKALIPENTDSSER